MDPSLEVGPLVAAFSSVLPPPYAVWLGWLVGIASIACSASTLFTALVRPPAATAPRAWLAAYRVCAWPAGNFGWARNAVVPGMPAAVRDAAALSARLAAAAPQLTVVAEPPAIGGTIGIAPPPPTALLTALPTALLTALPTALGDRP